MRVLFYGGCHAEVLNRIFTRFCAEKNFTSDVLTNFVLIGEGKPFPYDRLSAYDYVVYSPIQNKGDYNTEHLKTYCAAQGIKAICFPWMQWNGYHPRSRIVSNMEWMYPDLLNRRGDFANFDQYYEWMRGEFIDNSEILDHLDVTSTHLREHEQAANCDVSISDFIAQNYQQHLLFVTPNHPATVLYVHVAKQIADLMGVTLSPALDCLSSQLQSEHFLPILPRVATALNLTFPRGEYLYKAKFGDHLYAEAEWLALYYFGGRNRLLMTPFWDDMMVAKDCEIHVASGQWIIAERRGGRFFVIHAAQPVHERLPTDRIVALRQPGKWWRRGHNWHIYPLDGFEPAVT